MRKMTNEELERFNSNINNVINSILNVAQVKASLRLMRDEEGIDKELLDYTNRALNQQMLSILQTCVPQPPKRKEDFFEAAKKLNDPTLNYLTKDETFDWQFCDSLGSGVLSQSVIIKNTLIGEQYAYGVQTSGHRCILIKEKAAPTAQIWCDKCSWTQIDLIGKTTILCSKCNKKLMEKIPSEHNSML